MISQDVIMNFFGTVLYVAVGGIALHYWIGYRPTNHYRSVTSEQGIGITVGILCVISGAIYLIDTVLSFIHFVRDLSENDWNYNLQLHKLVNPAVNKNLGHSVEMCSTAGHKGRAFLIYIQFHSVRFYCFIGIEQAAIFSTDISHDWVHNRHYSFLEISRIKQDQTSKLIDSSFFMSFWRWLLVGKIQYLS